MGVIAAMVTHAAGESAARWIGFTPAARRLPPHTTAVVLEAKDERHLEHILAHIIRLDVAFEPIFESGGPYANQLMAIGLLPANREAIGHLLKEYQTLKSSLDNPKEGV